MIEILMRQYLEARLGVKVYMEVPERPPERYVILEKSGGGMEDHIYSALMIVQSYAPTLLAAATLNEEVKGALLYGALPDEICRVSLNSDYNFTDPTTKKYRYQAVYDIIHY